MLTPMDWIVAIINFIFGFFFGINLQEMIDKLTVGIFAIDVGLLTILAVHYWYTNPEVAQSLLNYMLEKTIYMMVGFVLGSIPGMIINAFAEGLGLR